MNPCTTDTSPSNKDNLCMSHPCTTDTSPSNKDNLCMSHALLKKNS